MQRTDKIVMTVVFFVVQRCAFLHQLGQLGHIQGTLFLHLKNLFGQPQQITTVAIGHIHKRRARFRHQGQRAVQLYFRAVQQGFKRRLIQPLEHHHLTARQKRRIQLE